MFKKFTPISTIITLGYFVWLFWFFTQAQYYFNYHEYVYALTATAMFACFFFAVRISNQNFGVKLIGMLGPYLAWIWWLVTQNIEATAPALFAPVLIIGVFSFIIACFVMAANFNAVDAELLKSGERAMANILQVEDTNITLNGNRIVVKLTVEVHSASKGTFSAQVQTAYSRVQLPRPGDTVNVVFDPANPKSIAII